jgi:thioredoxin 1
MTNSAHPRLRDTDDSKFHEDLKSASLVLVKFAGAWCPPCRAMQPTIEALVNERAELLVLSVDVDSEQQVAQQYGVRAVPTLIAFRNGPPSDSSSASLRERCSISC